MTTTAHPKRGQLLQPGQQLGGYQVEALIGRGGMGEVYRARQLSMDRHVALKVLSPRLARQDPQFAARFVEEARAAGRLNHGNLVAVHDVGQAPLPNHGEEVHYFSMELVDGESVKEVLVREGVCSEELVAIVMLGMAEALCYAETVGIIHRDIKPDNIMLTSKRTVKLADLGLATQAGSQAPGDRDEQGKAKVMGTPLYMSPEQARAYPLDHRSDQYSLGATLFHMLTGEPPYPGDDARTIMRSHVYDEIPDPQTVRAEVSAAWKTVCMKLMAKDPAERYANAEALRTAVRAAVGGRVLRTGSSYRRPRNWVGMAVTAATILISAGVIWYLVLAVPAASAQRPAAPVRPAEPSITELLAGLPAGSTAALAQLDDLEREPRFAGDPAAITAIAAERVRRTPKQIEDPAAVAKRAELDALRSAIVAGKLSSASATADRLALAENDTLRRQLNATIAKVRADWDRRIDALQAAGLAAFSAEFTVADLTPALRTALAKKLEAKQKEWIAQTEVKPETSGKAAWRALYAAIDPLRGSSRFPELRTTVDANLDRFPPEDRPLVVALADLSLLIQQAEGALRLVLTERPELELRQGPNGRPQRVKLVGMTSSALTWQPIDPPGPEATAARAVATPTTWSTVLERALTDAGAEDPARILAAFLWFWRDPAAAAAVAKLGEAPLAQALLRLEERGRSLRVAVPLATQGEAVSLIYDFSANGSKLLEDFVGEGREITGSGLRWITSEARDPRQGTVPTLRWREALRPPFSATAAFTVEPGSQIAVGVMSGVAAVRAAIVLRRGIEPFGVIVTRADGKHDSFPLPESDRPKILAGTSIALTASVAADGTVALSVGGIPLDQKLSGKLPRMPAGQSATFVIQSFQSSGRSACVLQRLELSGTAP
ncbi:hypothetical protein LBMAG53_35600 [Planctomycetota bacterium]|nr:hypothetical protein LBMAG53_35600 [Planctomycetota bacterium]